MIINTVIDEVSKANPLLITDPTDDNRAFFLQQLKRRLIELSYFALIKPQAMSNLNYIFPFFIIEHLQQSVAFYVDKLGFEVRHMGPSDDPFWAIVGRDNISIMLKAITPEIKPVPNHTRHPWAPWDAFISTADPDVLFEEYSSRRLAFRQPIMDNHDGLRGFELADADGYVLFFGRPKTDASNYV